MTRRAGLGIDLPCSCFTREQFSLALYNGFLEGGGYSCATRFFKITVAPLPPLPPVLT